jgi:DNA-binding response OmpR family regulator
VLDWRGMMVAGGPAMDRVAIVEDDLDTREFLGFALAAAGYTPLLCATFSSAVTMIPAMRPAVVITDYHLGSTDGDGCDLVARLQADPSTAMIPVIMCSADVTSLWAAVERCGVQPDAIIEKPFDPGEFVRHVAAVIERRSSTPV